MAVSVLVLSALSQERRAFGRLVDTARESRLRGHAVVTGTIGDADVVIAEIGIGKVNAAAQTALLVDRFGPTLIVFTGVAGGLDPSLEVDDVVIATDVVQHDAGIHLPSGFVTYQPGHVPFFNPTDRLGHGTGEDVLDMVRKAVAGLTLPAGRQGRQPRIVFGRLLSGDSYVHSPVVRDRLHAELGGLAVEMEGGAVAQIADGAGIGFVVVRAISDLAGEESGRDFSAFLDRAATNSAVVVRTVVTALAMRSVR